MSNQEIQIKATDEDLKGRYANAMQVGHTKEEFVLDFINITFPTGTIQSRIITSPGHAKRIISALSENIRHYEEKFGKIEEAEAPRSIGFKV